MLVSFQMLCFKSNQIKHGYFRHIDTF